jgi:hypothetical protein
MQVWDAFDATKRSETHAARRYALVTCFRRVVDRVGASASVSHPEWRIGFRLPVSPNRRARRNGQGGQGGESI